ncbi:uncharacterized protein MCYG_00574 [Microsporum canis CBS 113480]|uniref:Uncharacterized protein n=1 Tax=Arthroderma otae (strain ATCC MYA-4605 / CBS 113480) TaxID=554155 RepID=C5FD02_ARTOC|nr:uncharacterized protein MCYG_00574 [Microsporum canis CBS 113480]EEQ27686.1 predicted protein [Microsporum canis CBS 113480]
MLYAKGKKESKGKEASSRHLKSTFLRRRSVQQAYKPGPSRGRKHVCLLHGMLYRPPADAYSVSELEMQQQGGQVSDGVCLLCNQEEEAPPLAACLPGYAVDSCLVGLD